MYLIVVNKNVKQEKVVEATLWTDAIWKPKVFNSLTEVEEELAAMEERGFDVSEAVVMAPMGSI